MNAVQGSIRYFFNHDVISKILRARDKYHNKPDIRTFWQTVDYFQLLEKLRYPLSEYNLTGKGKGHHRTGHEDPEGEQLYSSSLSFKLGARWWVGDQRHAPAALPPGKRPGTCCVGGWMGPRNGLNGCGKSRLLKQDSIPGPSSSQRVAIPTELQTDVK